LIAVQPACFGQSRWPGRVATGVFIFAGAVTVADNASCMGPCTFRTDLNNDIGLMFVALGLVGLVYNELRHIDPEPALPDPPTELHEPRPAAGQVPEPPTTDPMLRQLTLQASYAAREHHCDRVVAVARQVEDRDPAYRASGFVADPAIAACLAR
jgi:hypothetical protein